MLKVEAGVKNVDVVADAKPLTVMIGFDPQTTNTKRISETAKQALESDPHNTAPVTVIYEEEK